MRSLGNNVRFDPEQKRLGQRSSGHHTTYNKSVAHLRMLKGIPLEKVRENQQGNGDPIGVEVHAVLSAKLVDGESEIISS